MRELRTLRTYIKLIAISMLFSQSCFAAVNVSSDQFSIDTKKNKCFFKGNAKATYVNEQMIYMFKADEIVVEYEKTNNKPKKISASKNIVFTHDNLSINSDYCSFDMKTIKFTNNIKIVDKDNSAKMEADEAFYTLSSKRIDIISKEKVKLTVNEKKLRKKHKNS